jgi:hypothetical protein
VESVPGLVVIRLFWTPKAAETGRDTTDAGGDTQFHNSYKVNMIPHCEEMALLFQNRRAGF